MNWYLKALKQYADFSGRARRKEFWMFTLVDVIVTIALAGMAGIVPEIGTILYLGYVLATLIPKLAVCVRRLHDSGKSGWDCLYALIPFVGVLILLDWCGEDSQVGKNKWGANPKGNSIQGKNYAHHVIMTLLFSTFMVCGLYALLTITEIINDETVKNSIVVSLFIVFVILFSVLPERKQTKIMDEDGIINANV